MCNRCTGSAYQAARAELLAANQAVAARIEGGESEESACAAVGYDAIVDRALNAHHAEQQARRRTSRKGDSYGRAQERSMEISGGMSDCLLDS